MSLANSYNMIPHELSGSMSKNRFRLELLWGISKMFDLYDKPAFTVVFDYKCDVEVHLPDSFEFYQIKSHKIAKPYTFKRISSKGKGDKASIIGKLFLLRCAVNGAVDVKLAIVSNAFLSIDGKIRSDDEFLPLAGLDEKAKEIIYATLQKEFPEASVDLSGIHYIYTSMDLIHPEETVKGQITGFFERIKGCEPIKPNALYRLIKDTAESKACYELASTEYQDVIKNKGITKNELGELLERHIEHTDDTIETTRRYIEDMSISVSERKKMKKVLVSLLEDYHSSKELKRKERELATFIAEKDLVDELPETLDKIADLLAAHFGITFSAEYGREYIYVFCIFIIKRWEAGLYD